MGIIGIMIIFIMMAIMVIMGINVICPLSLPLSTLSNGWSEIFQDGYQVKQPTANIIIVIIMVIMGIMGIDVMSIIIAI